MFDQLAAKATTPLLVEFVEYVRTNWIEGALWTLRTWSVFNEAIRTIKITTWRDGMAC
jgi:hypothetical protein